MALLDKVVKQRMVGALVLVALAVIFLPMLFTREDEMRQVRVEAPQAPAMPSLPEVKVGVFPAQVLSVLGDLLPRRVLNELCLTGEPFSAERALNVGLINAVADDVDEALQALLDKLLDKSPAAIRRGLYTLKHTEHMTFEQSMAFTESQIALFALTEDAAEGQTAFRDKRKPQWSGR